MPIINSIHKGYIQSYGANGSHCGGGVEYFSFQYGTGTYYANGTEIMADQDVATSAVMFSENDDGSLATQMKLTPAGYQLSSTNATLDNVTVWSANSILTRDYADGRYAPISATIDGGTALTTNTGSYDGGDAIAN
jgi:hypothetical protein